MPLAALRTLPVLDRHRLVRRLAVGGMAEVYLGEQVGPSGYSKRVAIKRLLPGMDEDPRFLELFLDEARLAASLQHPNLAQILDVGLLGGRVCMVMEYVEGASLSRLLQAARAKGRPRLPSGVAASILRQACEGLEYAHGFKDPKSGQPLDLVHRDVSPHNLLLDRQGTVKVCDFGIAKSNRSAQVTPSGEIRGKIAYMAPEQAMNRPLDRRADVWSLGAILYELIHGRRAIQGDNPGSMLGALSSGEIPFEGPDLRPIAGLTEIMRLALQHDPRFRTPSAAALSAQLGRWLARGGIAARPEEVADWALPLMAELPSGPELSSSAPSVIVEEPTDELPAAPGVRPPATESATEPAAEPAAEAKTRILAKAPKAAPPTRRRRGRWLAAAVALAAVAGWLARSRLATTGVAARAPVAAAPPMLAEVPQAALIALAPSLPMPPEPAPVQPVPAAAPRTVAIHLRSQPSGALVFAADEPGHPLGVTPLDLVRPPSDRAIVLSFRLAGHEPSELRLVPDRDQTLSAALAPRRAPPTAPPLRSPRPSPRPGRSPTPARPPESKGGGDSILDPFAR